MHVCLSRFSLFYQLFLRKRFSRFDKEVVPLRVILACMQTFLPSNCLLIQPKVTSRRFRELTFFVYHARLEIPIYLFVRYSLSTLLAILSSLRIDSVEFSECRVYMSCVRARVRALANTSRSMWFLTWTFGIFI